MISNAEQQFIIKLQDQAELAKRYKADVLLHEKFGGAQTTEEILNASKVLADISILNEDCRIEFTDGVWSIDLGGLQTKKKVKLKGATLHICLAKAMIIYVRKYL